MELLQAGARIGEVSNPSIQQIPANTRQRGILSSLSPCKSVEKHYCNPDEKMSSTHNRARPNSCFPAKNWNSAVRRSKIPEPESKMRHFLVHGILDEQKGGSGISLPRWSDGWIISRMVGKKWQVWVGFFHGRTLHQFRGASRKDSIEEFNKLAQTSTILEYQEQFEHLQALMNADNPTLLGKFFISNFISNFNAESQSMI